MGTPLLVSVDSDTKQLPDAVLTALVSALEARSLPQFHGVRYTAYGHSFGQVQNPKNSWAGALYPARIRDLIRADASIYQNQTANGLTMDQIATRAQSTWTDGNGGLVTLMGNQNSVGTRQTEAAFKSALRSFITTILGATGAPPTLLIFKDTTCTATGYGRYSPAPTDANVAVYNQYISDVVGEFSGGWIVVADPVADGWDPQTMTAADGQHPNERGAAHLARSGLKALASVPYRPGLNLGVAGSLVPTPPSALSLSAVAGDGQVTVSRSGGAGPAVSYALYRGTVATGTPIATSFPFTDTGRTNGSPVTYIATATNAYGTTTSATVTATPNGTVTATVYDSFTRADNTTSLGNAETGQPWVVSGVDPWGISGGTAYRPVTTGASDTLATISASATVDMTVVIAQASNANGTGGMGPVWRYSDANNFWLIDISAGATAVYKKVAGSFVSVGTISTLIAAGDTIRVTASGSTHTIYINGAQAYTTTDAFNSTATSHGMRTATAGTGGYSSAARRFDSFKVI
ncbi:hypothetical protein NYQ35_16165 [Curtobacterium flaccumfaciens pv. flaccumfaciens]|uniref:SGNH/GDSL hydrolase family protein n=1 Tax=Curtobacterium flaccumfaciens TaxID=2035 RepID=UPI00217DCB53|nr:SGNH/GDSL hydrolase family protein [Curtobacterium flaccumfaciens]MCS6570342.1 hypothetical protein [Curtobacterium flaccumfaciens pv. flaccumfaciens]MCS6585198.1 hypothetical protein [Curtobacterium flaccumfaciens pv. flaccumfaciens]